MCSGNEKDAESGRPNLLPDLFGDYSCFYEILRRGLQVHPRTDKGPSYFLYSLRPSLRGVRFNRFTFPRIKFYDDFVCII